ncbi:MAG: hypothetical protein ACFB2Z_08150 [Maricaulaceae bacterium]
MTASQQDAGAWRLERFGDIVFGQTVGVYDRATLLDFQRAFAQSLGEHRVRLGLMDLSNAEWTGAPAEFFTVTRDIPDLYAPIIGLRMALICDGQCPLQPMVALTLQLAGVRAAIFDNVSRAADWLTDASVAAAQTLWDWSRTRQIHWTGRTTAI